MPLPQEFMERVVAWPGPSDPGFINLHWTSPKSPAFLGTPYRTVQEFMSMAQYAATKPGSYKEIYFCLSTQAITKTNRYGRLVAHRHKDKAIALKAIWIDVDVKPDKGYATLEEALDAIARFVTDARLPPPSALVFSGGGVHVYWISNRALRTDEWRRYAEGLKAEILRHGLRCDSGLTTDCARVLRVPGTFNYKTSPPRPVVLKHLGNDYDFGTDLVGLAALPQAATQAVTAAVTKFDLTGWAAPRAEFAGLKDNLAEGLRGDDRPLDPSEVIKNCKHFRESFVTGGKGQSQGLWMHTVLASTWFDKGRDFAHALSKGYPSYTPDETDAMYDRKVKDRADHGLGWPGCKAFEGEGAKCKTCPFYGKIKSPLHLANRVQPAYIVVNPTPPPPDDLMLPENFTLDPKGQICEIVTKTAANGITTEEHLPLFLCKLRKPVLQGGTRKFRFETSLDMDNWGDVSFDEADIASEQKLLTDLRRYGVKPNVPYQRRIANFVTSWMAKIDAAKYRQSAVAFGWVRPVTGGELPMGFAYGGKVATVGGGTQPSGLPDQQLMDFYTPKGSPDPWWQALKLITDQHHPALEVIVATSFASPLLFATGQYNGVVCSWSRESGAHKSTSIAVGAAVWGSPKLTKERPITTQKGIIHKLGQLKNLPVYWDEISTRDKMEDIRDIVGQLSEGGGGSRLKTDRTFFDLDEWQTLMTIGANTSLVETIVRTVHSTDAQLRRVFEFEVEKRGDTAKTHEVGLLISSLDYNYGHVGIQYSKLLGNNPAGIKQRVMDIQDAFANVVTGKSENRFRLAMASSIFAGAELANQMGCEFNLGEIWDFLVHQYRMQSDTIANAGTVGGTVLNTENAMSQFFKASVRHVLTVSTLPVSKPGRPPAIAYIDGPNRSRPDPIHIRCSVSDEIIDVSKARLLHWLSNTTGFDADGVISGLKNHFGATEMHRVNLAYGAQVIGSQETIIRIPAPPGSIFASSLSAQLTMDQRPLEPGQAVDVTAPVTDAAASTQTPPDPTGPGATTAGSRTQ